jgi:hypothetical protein
MADEVAEWLVRYGSPLNGVVGDNFLGSGTTAIAAKRFARHYVGSDLNAGHVAQAQAALAQVVFGSYHSSEQPQRSGRNGRLGSQARAVSLDLPRRCRHCPKEFIPKTRWQNFCSAFCRYQFNNDRRGKA